MDPTADANDAHPEGFVDYQMLHRYISLDQIEELHEIFEERVELFPEELRSALTDVAGIEFSDEDFELLFMKLNTNWDEFCQWDEFVSYLLLGLQIDDPLAVEEALVLPIADEPDAKLGRQTYQITKIEYSPTFSYDGVADWSEGFWVTTSREGFINIWKRDWHLHKAGKAFSVDLKRSTTVVLDTVVLPNQNMLCVACLECELRFYDIIGAGFFLYLIINRLENPINALFYHYSSDSRDRLLLGDNVGKIYIIEYYPESKEPITEDMSSQVLKMSFSNFMAGCYPQMVCTDYGRMLPDIVRQLEYVQQVDCFLACSELDPLAPPLENDAQPVSLVIQEMSKQMRKSVFAVPYGVTCFCFYHPKDLLATGGPDGKLRLWDIYRPDKPTDTLPGHNAGVMYLFFQDRSEKLYSMDTKKIVKIWDVPNKTLIQTYRDYARKLYKTVPACAYYDDRNRVLYVGANRVLATPCSPEIAMDVTDGESHNLPISVLLYNPLFKVVISCGLDSFIIVWNHWLNRKLLIIPDAHTRIVNGLVQNVEITAACFNLKLQLLLTGAHDGSMKIWNFNNGSCVYSMGIEEGCEVTAVFWGTSCILAMGWNHVVVDFHVGETEMEFQIGHEWQKLHSDDILCATINRGRHKVLATCSYSGELLLWMIATGQAYRRFDAGKPTSDLPVYIQGLPIAQKRRRTRMSMYMPNESFRQRRLTQIVMPLGTRALRKLTIHKLLFLESRPMHPEYGTLLCSLDNGTVQIYSHHPDGKYLGSFNAIHMAGDRVLSMATDPDNKFLFTGTYLGYLKIWLMENYHVPPEKQVRINKPAMRIQFPFLLEDVIPGRAKRSVTDQPNPWLLSSHLAHHNCITDIVYIAPSKLLLTASSDRTIRLWSLAGRYIGLLGSPYKWPPLSPNAPAPSDYAFRIPPDLRREVSFTTAQVLAGGERKIHLQGHILKESTERRHSDVIQTYGEPLEQPILKRETFPFAERTPFQPDPELESLFGFFQAFEHLKVHEFPSDAGVDENVLRVSSALDASEDVDRIDSYQEREKGVFK
ncbi:WD repeat-containing protein on Y chromosome [Toxorhynchites rutilus septentrionalis]|uniref:WD repeat-containing protein on Y chromosome n=1 Tax=Toxorhynchites rutilus septentrionalis TaxID=329112 RepID=UPI002478CB0B|nr:WD repeat-containing protein on Y chromosome [Toxorhynchites rutilus septentrionalis]